MTVEHMVQMKFTISRMVGIFLSWNEKVSERRAEKRSCSSGDDEEGKKEGKEERKNGKIGKVIMQTTGSMVYHYKLSRGKETIMGS